MNRGPMLRKTVVVVVTMLLVSTVALSGVFGSIAVTREAEAASSTECMVAAAAAGMSAAVGIASKSTSKWAVNACTEHSTSEEAVTKLSKNQGFAQSLGIKDTYRYYSTSVWNRIEGARSLATMQAKIAAVNALNNGTSKSTTKFEVNQTIEDYYSAMQYNLLKQWNTMAKQVEYLSSTALKVAMNDTESDEDVGSHRFMKKLRTRDVTLANGTDVRVHYIMFQDAKGNGQWQMLGPAPPSAINGSTCGCDFNGALRLVSNDPSSSGWGDAKKFLDSNKYVDAWQKIVTQVEQVRSNINTIVDNVYAEFTSGELNTTDLLSPITLAHRAGTAWNSTGGYQYAAIQLATLGYSGDINTTATVTTNLSSATYTGTLYYTGDDLPNGTLVAGKTYDTAKLNGTFVMAVQGDNGNTWVEEWNHVKITVEGLRDAETGESLNKTTVVDYTSNTTNVSALASRVNRLEKLTRKYRRLAKQGDTETSGISLGRNQKVLIGIAFLALLGAMYARRDENGGSGGMTLIESGQRRGGDE